MNCAQHPDAAAVAYCRNCGKALCDVCKRDVQGTIFCEPCLVARVHGQASYGTTGYGPAGAYPPPPRRPEDASPGLALFLGFIPGVGAFYNGQFMKGFVHVIVFSTLIWLSDHGAGGFAGILIPAWLFYMVFDAYSTAKARRYGTPLPDPLGLNAIFESRQGTFRERMEHAGHEMGTRMEHVAREVEHHWNHAGAATPGGTPGATSAGAEQGTTTATIDPNAPSGATQGAAGSPPPGSAGYVGPQGTYYAGPEGTYYGPGYVPPKETDRNPVGAIVLIGLGLLLLLANLGWFSFHWISHFWPLILIGLGVWLFVKRTAAKGGQQ